MSRATLAALSLSSPTLLALALMLPGAAHAQSHDDIAATAQRLGREVPCVRAQHERLGSTLRLLEEAQRQAASETSGDAARRDAVHSAEALELRVEAIVTELRACLGQGAGGAGAASTHGSTAPAPQTTHTPNPAHTYSGTVTVQGSHSSTQVPATQTPPPRVVVRHEADVPALHPAEVANSPTEVLDSNRQLVGSLFLVQAERVDGLGRADNQDVRTAVSNVAPQINACYEQLTDRGALQRGRVYLTFTVTPEGRVRDIRLENFTIYDRTFQRCVGAAAGHLRVREPATGGSARYSFHLRFGPPPDLGTPEVD